MIKRAAEHKLQNASDKHPTYWNQKHFPASGKSSIYINEY